MDDHDNEVVDDFLTVLMAHDCAADRDLIDTCFDVGQAAQRPSRRLERLRFRDAPSSAGGAATRIDFKAAAR